MVVAGTLVRFYEWALSKGEPRVEEWPLMATPGPTLVIFLMYLVTISQGPKLMESRKPMDLSSCIVVYNLGLVLLSAYMFYEMASVCWWYFSSKVIELVDTLFLILKKNPISFLHTYHHSTTLLSWWLRVKYVAGGQSFFLAMLDTFVHVVMNSYFGLSALGPHVRKYLWWRKYITLLQLSQFFAVVVHTGVNTAQPNCAFPQGFNYAVFLYAISVIVLFGYFFQKTYDRPNKIVQKERQYF